MNYSMIRYIIFWVLRLEGVLMGIPCVVALIYHEKTGFAFLFWAILTFAIGMIGALKKPKNTEIYQKEGFVAVALCWLAISFFGAAPFVMTGEIPSYVDALFEIVSGFTTTGASILTNVEALSHASLLWRSFSHWIGGMGVLVFILMLIPVKNGSQMNLLRAESPGPSVSKFVPRVRNTAIILYDLYIFLTVAELIALLITKMPAFDAVCIAFGTAGTGGFGVLNVSCGAYTVAQQWIITVFMIMFGVNFTCYYLIFCKKLGAALKMEEVRAYFIVIGAAITVISINIFSMYGNIADAVRDAAFQVGSIITTTGFSTVDFNLWPDLSKTILVSLMFLGACAGSTGGGIKVSRVLILCKTIKKEMRSIAHPRSIKKLKMDGQPVEHETLRSTNVYIMTYIMIFALSLLIISFNSFGFETNFTAVAATLNNIGPGLGIVGPAGSYASFNVVSKIVLIFDMLAGRLELFPVIVLLMPSTWKRRG